MRNFALYLKDMEKPTSTNPNVNTPGYHRKVTQYHNPTLRKGLYQPRRLTYRKNKIYQPARKINQITNKIREDRVLMRFKTFITEDKSDKDVLDRHMGKKLISTVHSKERTEERNANNDMVKHIFKKAVEHVAKHGAKYGKNEHFVVKSKKFNRSASFHYRPDNKSTNDTRSHFIHTSTFPHGQHHVNPQSKGIVVEGQIDYIEIEVE